MLNILSIGHSITDYYSQYYLWLETVIILTFVSYILKLAVNQVIFMVRKSLTDITQFPFHFLS